MASVWSELKRRNVVKVAIAYAIVGWLLIEVSSTVLPTFAAPEWVLQTITFVIFLGFALALILSWAYEVTPEGMRPSHEVPVTESITHVTGRKIDFAIIGALVLALGFVVYNYVLEDGEGMADVLSNSVAVLPFENLSPDPDNAYFAAGMHEEILNQLVTLRNLSVISRTSVLRYEDSDLSIPEIANELNVQTIMEGSVRYAGNRVRISAQLIDAETDEHLWSDVYERDISDIFGIQADIAMNIANALEAEFSPEEQERIEKIPTESPEAYRFYLAALRVSNGREPEVRRNLLSQAIDLDPTFALAYAARAASLAGELARFLGEADGPSRITQQEALALQDLQTALALDPNLTPAHLTLAQIEIRNWRGAGAQAALEKALDLSPNDPRALSSFALFKSDIGEHQDALRMKRHALELDPTQEGLGNFLLAAGDLDSAAAEYRRALELEQNVTNLLTATHFGLMEIVRGNHMDAETYLRLAEPSSFVFGNGILIPQIAYGYARLGFNDDARRLLVWYDEFSTNQRVPAASRVMVSLARGDEARALEWLNVVAEKAPYEGFNLVLRIKRNVFHDSILNKPDFVELREQLGFTDL